jgi:hypothetical protein
MYTMVHAHPHTGGEADQGRRDHCAMRGRILLLGVALAPESSAFRLASPCVTSQLVHSRTERQLHCCAPPPEESPERTRVGSKEYYKGFFTQPVDENVTIERGDGTEQAAKFAASSAVGIAVLFLGFMASNGLIG